MDESDESLADIARSEGAAHMLPGAGDDQEQAGEAPKDKEKTEPSRIDRRELLQKPCALAWSGGCGLAVMLTEVDELGASDAEKKLAGEHLANILDVIMPDEWLTEFDPDSKVGRVVVSGAVLAHLIKAKAGVYDQVIAQREAEAEKEKGGAGGEKSESKAA